MEQLLAAASLAAQIRKDITTMAQADALISKWADKELGPNPLDSAVHLEARNQVFGWGR